MTVPDAPLHPRSRPLEKPMQRESPTELIIPQQGAMHVPARIFVNETLAATLDSGAVDQLVRAAGMHGIVGEALAMPDAHIGYGFPVGGVAAFDAEHGLVSPGAIGFDINCGVRLLATNRQAADVVPIMSALLDRLAKLVPVGTGTMGSITLSPEELDDVLFRGAEWALDRSMATQADLATTESGGRLRDAVPSAVSRKAKERGAQQLGTLGSGNHFLEFQTVEQVLDAERAHAYGLREGQLVILIHCGSRGVGHQVCTDAVQAMMAEYPDLWESIGDRNLTAAPLQSALGQQYWGAMCAAANYAWANRQVITHRVRVALSELLPDTTCTLVYDVSHNIAKREHHTLPGAADGMTSETREVCVHRKGATRAFGPGHADLPDAYRALGQPVLIPGSMGTASWVLAGASGAMTKTFGSCCHGAGRRLSRTQALSQLTGATVQRELAARGIIVKAASVAGIAEEAPEAYKNVDDVIRVVAEAGIAVPVARCTPLGVLKG